MLFGASGHEIEPSVKAYSPENKGSETTGRLSDIAIVDKKEDDTPGGLEFVVMIMDKYPYWSFVKKREITAFRNVESNIREPHSEDRTNHVRDSFNLRGNMKNINFSPVAKCFPTGLLMNISLDIETISIAVHCSSANALFVSKCTVKGLFA
ncbi:uncharacterized protein BT62DRAFT_1078338 [Guyanagaster necrorhizus]|uniref:Uncharacterized protein n=1 Tax=Guyanagaster necrorhizus TaxID=856835 RepID=A0A9P8AQ15_9AGAR|nr:uncharacterized protein BT62DRAFT_1078338 [Guyanagaster necrorhizus MCA 3950]KAG7443599.1 hypothetical protein BT62DRAFT_1078338 [Guyanagaster necrorhizus MCA 3950]